PTRIELLSAAPWASWLSMTDVTSRTPRTSPIFQSVLGEPGMELWQSTHDCATIVSATATRTICLPLRSSPREKVDFGLAVRKSQASCWNASSLRSLRFGKGYLLYRLSVTSSFANKALRSWRNVAGSGISLSFALWSNDAFIDPSFTTLLTI